MTLYQLALVAVIAATLAAVAVAVWDARRQARKRQHRLKERAAWGEFQDGRWTGKRVRSPLDGGER